MTNAPISLVVTFADRRAGAGLAGAAAVSSARAAADRVVIAIRRDKADARNFDIGCCASFN